MCLIHFFFQKCSEYKESLCTSSDARYSPKKEIHLNDLMFCLLIIQVEMLVMKALSLGLVKGSIDEIDQKVHMTWVQPRVLDLQQVSLDVQLFTKVIYSCIYVLLYITVC